MTRRGVVMLTSTFPARQGDGTPGFVLALAQAIAEHEPVTVVAPRTAGVGGRERIGQVEVIRFRYFLRRWEGLADQAILPTLRAERWRLVEVPFFLVAYAWTALRTVSRARPRVVNAHWVVPAGVLAWLLRAPTRTPYVLTAHGADAFALTGGASRWLKAKVLTNAAAVLPVSNDIRGELEALGARCEDPVPMGVDVAAIRAATSPAAPDPGSLLFIGRLAGKKGVPILLDAVAAVPDVTLVVVGDGPDRAALEQQAARLGIEDRVDFRGQQSSAAVQAALARAAAVVIPSVIDVDGDKDGTPVVLPEALAAGVPVIASALAGMAEHLRDGTSGLLVPPGDAPALAAAIRSVTSDPALASQLAEAGARVVEESFDLPVVAATYRRTFDRATGESGA